MGSSTGTAWSPGAAILQSGRTYEFVDVMACNMCGYPSAQSRVLGKRLDHPQGFRPKAKVGICTSVQRCRRCGLIYANPLPKPASVTQHYGTPPELFWTPGYFEVSPAYLRMQIERFQALRGGVDLRGLMALDIGAGIGKGMVALARAGFDAYGVEPSPDFRQRAIEGMGITAERLHLTAVEDAVFEDEFFDFVTFSAVLEHVYDPAAAITRAMRWLKTGGLMHIEVPSSAYLASTLMRFFYRATGSDYVINICPMHVPYHLYEFTPVSFERHSEAGGYRIAFSTYYPCTAYAPRWLDPLLIRLMQWTRTGMQLEIWLQKI
jgi:2-polyprenyl-3-methyl-5-hydroxy-6-metoxy-1,4-benzoquinol methylase